LSAASKYLGTFLYPDGGWGEFIFTACNNKHFSHAVSEQNPAQDAIAAPKKAKVVKTSPKSRNNLHGRL